MSESAHFAIWILFGTCAVIAVVLYWRKLMQDPASSLKEEQERKKHPLSKVELAVKQAENRKKKDADI
jgi:uncharacterized ion transporter superfamily protein YfcC